MRADEGDHNQTLGAEKLAISIKSLSLGAQGIPWKKGRKNCRSQRGDGLRKNTAYRITYVGLIGAQRD